MNKSGEAKRVPKILYGARVSNNVRFWPHTRWEDTPAGRICNWALDYTVMSWVGVGQSGSLRAVSLA
jgi:hypothetical protein